jgi:hypothetical protein
MMSLLLRFTKDKGYIVHFTIHYIIKKLTKGDVLHDDKYCGLGLEDLIHLGNGGMLGYF